MTSMKPYCYATVGQQFQYVIEGTVGATVYVIAVPTGWLLGIELDTDTLQSYQLIPDKDHITNPRAFVPPDWQDDINENFPLHPPEHQRMADHLWAFKADEVVQVPGIFTVTQQVKGQEFTPTAREGKLIPHRRSQGNIAQDGFCRTITVHRYLNEEYAMEIDLEIGHRSDNTWQIRMEGCRPGTLIEPADIQQAHVMMLAMGFERKKFQTLKCNEEENPDAHPFLIADYA